MDSIGVWPEDGKWVVSLDTSSTSDVLHVRDALETATSLAVAEAAARRLPWLEHSGVRPGYVAACIAAGKIPPGWVRFRSSGEFGHKACMSNYNECIACGIDRGDCGEPLCCFSKWYGASAGDTGSNIDPSLEK